VKAPRIVVWILCLAAMATTASADETVQWKFRKGKKYNYVLSSKIAGSTMLQGQKRDASMTQIIDMTWEIEDVAPDGSARIVLTIDRVRFKTNPPGGAQKFDFDTREVKPVEGPQAVVAAGFKAMTNAPMDLKMTARGKVSDVKFSPDLAEAIKDIRVLFLIGDSFTAEGMETLITRASTVLPEEPIAQGKTWNAAFDTKMQAPMGTMSADNKYTYLGVIDQAGRRVEKIGIDSKFEFKPEPNSPFSVVLKAQEGKGAIFFDNVEGMLRGSEINQKIQMDFSVMNQDYTLDTETTITMTLAKPEPGPKAP
jgi:hypothetical protein